jgi:hypothetical protein
MLMEGVTSLNFVKSNYDVLEESDMFFSQRNSETRNDGSQNIQELRCTVEFEILVDQTVETVIDSLSDHLSSGNQFSVESMKDVLQILPFSGLFRVE